MLRRLLILLCAVLMTGSLSGCDPRQWFVCALGACGVTLDTRPPFPPQEPRAVAFSRGVALDWKASFSSDVEEYRIYRSTVSRGERALAGTSTTTSFRDTGLTNGTTYFYVIRAADAADRESAISQEVSAAPQASLAPAPPAGLTATAIEGAVDLLWAESFSATLYNVWRSTTPGGPYTKIGSTTGTSSRDTGIDGGTTYYYVVNAENADGAAGAFSNEVVATPGGGSGLAFSLAWDGGGTEPGRFDGLVDVTVDRFGNVYTLEDFPGWEVRRFSSTGTFASSWHITGDFRGIATDAAGNVYLTDALFDVVDKYSPAGVFQGSFGADQLTDPHGIAIDGEVVYVADEGGDRIQRFTIAGAYLGETTAGLDGPRGVAVDRQHAVYVVDGGNARVRRILGATVTTIGGPGTQNGEFVQPQDVTVTSGGVWVTDAATNRVQAFSTAGIWRTWLGGPGSDPGRFSEPGGIASDCQGNLYVSDHGNDRIQKFSPGAAAPCPLGRAVAFAGRSIRGTFVATRSRAGAFSMTSTGSYREKGARQRGTFRLPGGGKLSRGRWYALFDVSADPVKSTARAKGRMLAVGRGRRACLTFTVDVADGTVRGRFRGAARGSFQQRFGSGEAWSVRGTGTAGRPSVARCRKVAKAFRLRPPR